MNIKVVEFICDENMAAPGTLPTPRPADRPRCDLELEAGRVVTRDRQERRGESHQSDRENRRGRSGAVGGAKPRPLPFKQRTRALKLLRELCFLLNGFVQLLFVLRTQLLDDFVADAMARFG